MIPPPPTSTLFPYTTLFRSRADVTSNPTLPRTNENVQTQIALEHPGVTTVSILPSATDAAIKTFDNPHWIYVNRDRKSTRLNSSHVAISYAVFCLKKKKKKK